MKLRTIASVTALVSTVAVASAGPAGDREQYPGGQATANGSSTVETTVLPADARPSSPTVSYTQAEDEDC